MDRTRVRSEDGAARTATSTRAGASRTSRRFQDQARYSPAAPVASQMLRVKPNTRAALIVTKHNMPTRKLYRLDAGDQIRNAVSSSRAYISCPPNVIQWLMKP